MAPRAVAAHHGVVGIGILGAYIGSAAFQLRVKFRRGVGVETRRQLASGPLCCAWPRLTDVCWELGFLNRVIAVNLVFTITGDIKYLLNCFLAFLKTIV